MSDTTPTYSIQCYLKGSVATSIDNSGVITKTLTWIVLNTNETNTLLEWLGFQDYVENTWAGKIGDNWKKPIQASGEKECTSYDTEDTSFTVTDISVETPSGRTHCEVTYTCTSNARQINKFENGDYSVNSSNERTKSFSFIYTIPAINVALGSSTWNAPDLASVEDTIKGLFDINQNVTWVDSPSGDGVVKTSVYYVENVGVTQETANTYRVTVSLKDMSKMRVGLVTVNEDSFGQKTLSVVWRLSKSTYDSEILPTSGDKLDYTDKNGVRHNWLGDGYTGKGYEHYIITGVEHSPDGILGYLVTINAKDTTKTQLRTNSEYKWNGSGIEKSATITYQLKDVKNLQEEVLDKLGHEQIDLGYDSFTLRDASVSQNGKNDYELTLSLSDDGTPLIVNVGSNTPDDLAKDIQVSMTYGSFYLTPEQCGLKRKVSDLDYYEINNPPPTKFYHWVTISDLAELDEDGWTGDSIRRQLRENPPHLGFSQVTRARNSDGKTVKGWWHKVDRLRFSFETDAKNETPYVSELQLRDYVYPQPFINTKIHNGASWNPIFTPWVAKDSLLIIPGGSKYRNQYIRLDLSNWPKYKDKYGNSSQLDMALPIHWLNRKIPYMDCSVTINYRGNLQTVLSQDWGNLFINAVHQVCNKASLAQQNPDKISTTMSPTRTYSDFNKYFLMPYETVANKKAKYPLTSFKRTSMSVAKVIDSTGKEWTQVTMGIQALLGDFWNPNYKESVDFA